MSRRYFKKMIVLFWLLWWITAFLTDFIGGLNTIGITNIKWFAGENYPFLVQNLTPLGIPTPFIVISFVGIIVWLFLSMVLFAWAAFTPMEPRQPWLKRVDAAFMVSLGLWAAFFLADQTIMNFPLEENHMVQGGFQLLCYLAIYLLPDEPSHRASGSASGSNDE